MKKWHDICCIICKHKSINMEWFFSGIGSEIISALIGLFIGGVSGYKIGVRNKIKQIQKAGNNSKLSQTGSVVNNYGNK